MNLIHYYKGMGIQNLRKLDLNLLLILATLIEEKHVSRTADQLGLTQSAVSHALNRLRAYFQDDLFIRDGHSMQPTAFALSIYDDLNLILDQIQNLNDKRGEFNPTTCDQTFIIGLPEYLAISFLNPLNTLLSKKASHIKIITINTSLQSSTDILINNQADLIIGRDQDMPKSINTSPLCREDYICAIGKNHPLFDKKQITLKDYLNAKHMHISLKARDKGYIDEHLKTLGHKRDIQMTISNYLLGLLMIEKNMLVLTEPRQTILPLQKQLKIRTFKPPYPSPEIDIALFWHRKYDAQPAHSWLRSLIQDIAEKF